MSSARKRKKRKTGREGLEKLADSVPSGRLES